MRQNTHFSLKILVVRFLTAIFIISSVAIKIRAQTLPATQVSINLPDAPDRGAPERTGAAGRRIKFPHRKDRGAPARTGAGGRRGVCNTDIVNKESVPKKNDLIAITPKNNVITTVASHPTVYVYVNPNTGKQAKFRMVDEDSGKDIYETNFSLPNQAGIVRISLPKSVKLQTKKTYIWQFRVICDGKAKDKDQFVEGLIETKSLTSAQMTKIQQLKQPLEQAKLYAEYGIWAETVDILTSDNNPDLQKAWKQLLESVELKEVANYPIIKVK